MLVNLLKAIKESDPTDKVGRRAGAASTGGQHNLMQAAPALPEANTTAGGVCIPQV